MVIPLENARFLSVLALLTLSAEFLGCRALPRAASSPAALWRGQNAEATVSKFEPSNNRDWMPDLAVLPYVEINDDKVMVHNIRNCTYRADDEYVIKHYDRKFDLDRIRTVDFIVAPFKEQQGLAHTMLSFGFENGDQLCMSVEARLEKGEQYSPVLGALRQYELMYVLADERDVIVRRTRYRDVDVYLYHTIATPEQARLLLLDVLQRVNKLYREPEFYDSLTNNCTTNIVQHINHLRPDGIPLWDWRVVLPGYADQLAYELGLLDTSKPFEELRRAARINEPANRFAGRRDFSELIRR